MLRANQAVRLGLRAASRNAELSFAKGLINQGGNLLALLPIAFAAILIAALARGDALRSALLAAAALAGAVAVTGTFLLDALARLIMVRAAAFGDSATPAFARAVSLLGARLGASALITVVFVALELIVGAVAASLTGLLSAGSFNPRDQVLALAPHAAIALAAAAVFGWLEVGRMGAFAALAADAEGLIAPEAPPEPPPRAELVVEALPADET